MPKVTVQLRKFGKIIPFEVDLDAEVGASKPEIAKRTLRAGASSTSDVVLTSNGHEMRNHRKFSWYGISEGGSISVFPPRKEEEKIKRLNLTCVISGKEFNIEVDPCISVLELIKEIEREEKVPVHHLEYHTSSMPANDDEEWNLVEHGQPVPLNDGNAQLVDLPIAIASTRSVIYICPPPPPSVPPATFPVTVTLYEEEKRIAINVRLQMNLHEFRAVIKDQSGTNVENHVLILVGKVLDEEEIPLWDLGFVPGCTVHAVPYISFDVATATETVFSSMTLHPLTKLSALRKILEGKQAQNVSTDFQLEKHAFTIDGRSNFKEWRTLWGINLVSGSTLYIRPIFTVNITIRINQRDSHLDVELDETIAEVRNRFELILGRPVLAEGAAMMVWKQKRLEDHRTVAEEGIGGGDVILYLPLLRFDPPQNDYDRQDEGEVGGLEPVADALELAEPRSSSQSGSNAEH